MALSCEHVDVGAPLIVTNEEHRFLALEQLREIGVEPGAALLEPVARNTAPALTLAALAAVENGDDPVLVVTPADQTVADATAFNGAMHDAIRQATEGAIVILGVTPDRPETGYGYIQAVVASTPTLVVERFVEKPDEAAARQYLTEGGYYWNAGMFVLKASVWLQAIECFRPDIAATTRAAWARRSTDAAFVRPGAAEFADIPSDSIDYAVMERCPGSRFAIRMAPLKAGWSDLGAWDAVWSVLPKDAQGNAHVGDVLATDSSNTLVNATHRLVALVGVKNLVVVETPDAVLVADRSRSQDVKHIVKALQQQQREEHTLHRKVHRPWGWYDSIDEGGRFKVKRIQVKPKAILDKMAFRPIIDGQPVLMDARIFRDEPMGIRPELLDKPLAERFSYDPAQNLFFLDFSGLAVRSTDDIRRIEATVDAALDPVGHKVKAIVNYDRFSILPELIDDYIAMVKGVVDRHYHDVTRYTASTFLRMKLGEALAKRQMAPKISESEADARQQLAGN